MSEALAKVDADIIKQYPPTNPNRETAQVSEGSRSAPGKNPSVKLAWSQLTGEELKFYNAMPSGTWKKDEFLETVADDRKSKG